MLKINVKPIFIIIISLALCSIILFINCTYRHPINTKPSSSQEQLKSQYPIAYDLKKVGKYPGFYNSGAGYFYDEVLEYRVWIHPEAGGEDLCEGEDYFLSFDTYEKALDFSGKNKGTEEPLVLVLQQEWINEPKSNHFVQIKGKRIAEWKVKWLKGRKRNKDSITRFLEEHQKE